MTVAAILMAGGESRRMGSPKPLLDWGGVTLLEYQLRQLRDAGADDVIAVLGHEPDRLLPLVRAAGARAVVNENYREGRASSIRAGAMTVDGGTTAIVVLNVDQPRTSAITRRLLTQHAGMQALITVPVHGGVRGHPIVLAGSLLGETREVKEETQGLRGIVEAHDADVNEVEFDLPVVLLDLNEPGDYKSARRTYFEVAP